MFCMMNGGLGDDLRIFHKRIFQNVIFLLLILRLLRIFFVPGRLYAAPSELGEILSPLRFPMKQAGEDRRLHILLENGRREEECNSVCLLSQVRLPQFLVNLIHPIADYLPIADSLRTQTAGIFDKPLVPGTAGLLVQLLVMFPKPVVNLARSLRKCTCGQLWGFWLWGFWLRGLA
jgi:hypothetical protein